MAMGARAEKSTSTSDWPLTGLLTLTAAVFVAVTTEFLPLGLLPAMSLDLGATESRVGLLVTTYGFVVAVTAIPLTRATICWARRRLLAAVLAGYAISNAALALSDLYLLAAAARLVGGLCHALFFSIVTAYAARVVAPVQVGRAVAVVWVGTSLAFVLGVPLGTALGTVLGWRSAFVALSLSALLLAVAAGRLLPILPSGGDSTGTTPLATVLRSPGLAIVATTTGLAMLGNFTLFTYVSPFLRRAGLAGEMTSPALFVFGAAGVLGLWWAAVTVDRRPRASLLATLGLLTAALTVLAVAGTMTVATLVTLGMWGLAYGALPTFFNTAALRAAADAPDTAIALINTSFNIGIGGGALLGAQALEFGGLESLAPIAAVLTALGLMLAGLSSHAAFPPLLREAADG
jgi:predicted MFS family arabinose efflux permease